MVIFGISPDFLFRYHLIENSEFIGVDLKIMSCDSQPVSEFLMKSEAWAAQVELFILEFISLSNK